MSKKNKHPGRIEKTPRLKPETKKSIWAISLLGGALLLVFAGLGIAGPVGDVMYQGLVFLLGWGYAVLPLSMAFVAAVFLFMHERVLVGIALLGAGLLIFSLLGLIEVLSPESGGLFGSVLGSLKIPFGVSAAILLNLVIAGIAVLVTLDIPIKLKWPEKKERGAQGEKEAAPIITGEAREEEGTRAQEKSGDDVPVREAKPAAILKKKIPPPSVGTPVGRAYVPPPLSLLKSASEKPTTGDLRANANIIRRTLESFGIPVEMGEINIGPKVTRYTLKPAEGVKLSRILALHQDLALALAAHPIRIEAPIPGKSLVGIEVPNKAAALVRLGSLMAYPEFHTSGLLGFSLGRDVMGEPIFADIEKMPHLLIAGATGSGKSIMIHSLITALLYKNSPETLKFIMVDPKRVELSQYEDIPHLVSPVITESKKAIGVFRWAIKEMERRYDVLLHAGARDVKSYNAHLRSRGPSDGQATGGKETPLPFLLIVIDELADLMTSYGREVEGSVVRLAQMARATGLHLILSTQRPSVEVITGLIKANITSRIALQVASQVDSRTILDAAGAEKLLGGGDLLFVSSELSKPKRIQGAYITEEEVRAVADFIREHNPSYAAESFEFNGEGGAREEELFDEAGEEEDDELYHEAVEVVRVAKKASASLLQRRLKVGYARAARLLDLMEAHGVIGPGDGAKPREVHLER